MKLNPKYIFINNQHGYLCIYVDKNCVTISILKLQNLKALKSFIPSNNDVRINIQANGKNIKPIVFSENNCKLSH